MEAPTDWLKQRGTRRITDNIDELGIEQTVKRQDLSIRLPWGEIRLPRNQTDRQLLVLSLCHTLTILLQFTFYLIEVQSETVKVIRLCGTTLISSTSATFLYSVHCVSKHYLDTD